MNTLRNTTRAKLAMLATAATLVSGCTKMSEGTPLTAIQCSEIRSCSRIDIGGSKGAAKITSSSEAPSDKHVATFSKGACRSPAELEGPERTFAEAVLLVNEAVRDTSHPERARKLVRARARFAEAKADGTDENIASFAATNIAVINLALGDKAAFNTAAAELRDRKDFRDQIGILGLVILPVDLLTLGAFNHSREYERQSRMHAYLRDIKIPSAREISTSIRSRMQNS